ncbi:ELMO domain-containing protein 2 isoform X2 [Aplysia californica]|uniref:ELMO domain-containing protein 2 isoform X1 n=1 Tax=Aplysia californica TaxID=6500 RepID=A0ABM0JJS9_APLCA|nr:ELMO domain-containing protein 2 isoform X1 [Aplysia californica]XP_005095323.1 ELMO domain-containing protein 2 isoform X2 [Aplysia californica]
MLTDWLHEWWTKLYFVLLRPMLKWLLRHVTGKCELLRITYEESDRVSRTKRIESSLNYSSSVDVRRCATDSDYDISESVSNLMKLKDVVPEVHTQFEPTLKDSLLRIRAYNKILKEAEALRTTKYDAENKAHEKQLTELWSLYKSDVPLPQRVGPHWQELGFQGHDPKTDFRGMGMLGLQQLTFFAVNYPESAVRVFSQSHHPQYGFSFAIVAINITGMGFELLRKRKLRPHFYSSEKAEPDLTDFHHVYCYLLHDFTQFWLSEKPKDIMEFSRLHNKFLKQVKQKLKSDSPTLRAAFQEDSS